MKRRFILLSLPAFGLLLALSGCQGMAGGVEVAQPTAMAALPAEAAAAPALAPAAEQPDLAPTAPPVPTATASAAPSPTPTPAPILRQLTSGGCCVQPFWSPDGQRVLFLDRPSADAPTGFWGVPLEGGVPELWTDRLGLLSPDGQYRAFPQNDTTIVERLADGQRWTIPSQGRAVSFSPDSTQLAWTSGQSGPPFDSAQRQIWISRVDGSEARQVAAMQGGGFSGWFPDGQRLLLSGRVPDADPSQAGWSAFWALSLADGTQTEITRGPRLRGGVLSPGGAFLAYQVTFSEDPAQNGLWVANTATAGRTRVELFGAYRWRDANRLLVIPLEPGVGSHRLAQVEIGADGLPAEAALPTEASLPAEAGLPAPFLTDPQVTSFKIANGDWAVSPDGRHIAFVSAADLNIWLLTLNDE